jgi:cation-transporting ATPase E
LCLDKTGTLTDGTLSVSEIAVLDPSFGSSPDLLQNLSLLASPDSSLGLPQEGTLESSQEVIKTILVQFVAANVDDNDTAQAMQKEFTGSSCWSKEQIVPFSSERKWSGVSFKEQGTFVLGAPEFVFPEMNENLCEKISAYTLRGLRVLMFAQSAQSLEENILPDKLEPVALVILADSIRESAKATVDFFNEQGVEIKIISGDDPQSASTIAGIADVKGSERFIDMGHLPPDISYEELMDAYTVFGRTSPLQKQEMIRALKSNGKMVGMAGDGVNDVMALREADVSVALASGSEAAQMAADFVSIDSDFSSMVNVVREGRRLVNNIEAMASLFIVKTLYSMVLVVFFILMPFEYPYLPIQLTLLNLLMGMVPTFFLMFDPNYRPMNNRFAHRLVKDAVPAAVLIMLNVIALQIIGLFVPLTLAQLSTLSVLVNGAVRLMLIVRVCKPYNIYKVHLAIVVIAAYVCAFLFAGSTFELVPVLNETALIWAPMVVISFILFQVFTKIALRVEQWWLGRRVEPQSQALAV